MSMSPFYVSICLYNSKLCTKSALLCLRPDMTCLTASRVSTANSVICHVCHVSVLILVHAAMCGHAVTGTAGYGGTTGPRML